MINILLLSYELNKNSQRGVYQYSRSLIHALKKNEYRLGLFTQAYFNENHHIFKENIYSSLRDPRKYFLKDNNFTLLFINFLKNMMGGEFEIILNDSFSKNDYLKYIDFFLNKPVMYYQNNSYLILPEILNSPVDIDISNGLKNNVLFTTSPLRVRSSKHKIVQTVHDLIPIEEKMKNSKYFFKRLEACLYADKILCISEYTRNNLLEYFPWLQDKAQVVYQSLPIDQELIDLSTSPKIQSKVLKKYHLKSKQYMYYIGAVEERKNIHNLIQSYILATQSDKSIPLVISGSIDQAYSKKYNLDMYLVNNENYSFSKNNILKTDFVSDLEKLCLIRNSRAFLFPTLSEGFGIPVLEAQTLGIPVLTSNNTSLPEVVGSSALLLDNPLDTEEMIFNIKKLWEDNDLCVDLSVNGLINSQRFSKENFQVGINNFLTDF